MSDLVEGFLQGMQQVADEAKWRTQMGTRFALNSKYAKPGNYSTELNPDEERNFRTWVQQKKVPYNPDDDVTDYDMRGYWKDIASQGNSETAQNKNDGKTHYPDTYKTPYHASFSNESKYAQPNAPKWANDHQLVDPSTGEVVFDEKPIIDFGFLDRPDF